MAGLPWIKVWTVVAGHPKVQRLERELRLKDALGIVVRLWCWAADYAPDGEITEADAPVAARFARADACRTPPDAVLAAFVAVGLLDRIPQGYRVHDWHDMQTVHVEAEEKRRAQAAERQARYRTKRGVTGDAPVTRDVTRDVTDGVTRDSVTEKETEREIETEMETETPARHDRHCVLSVK